MARLHEILKENENCWRIARADKIAFLVDGENYFPAIRHAVLKARQSIFLVGWDIHSGIELDRSNDSSEPPTTLGDLLDYCAERNPDLHVYVLNWDFAMIYTLEREFFPQYKFQWKSHPRVEFCLDGNHPTGASQHQKLVVVDDCIAFSGGFDLAQWRWDTREHQPQDPRRRDPFGRKYQTFHDVQIAVSGAAAEALGELARTRWRGADGCELKTQTAPSVDQCWPEALGHDAADQDVAFSLTRPEWNGQKELRQVEQLYIESIGAAERFIYIENQYLTSHIIGDALAESLEGSRGPEIVLVLPNESQGWLEQHTMDVLRCRLLRRLREADQHDRLRIYYPRLADGGSLLVHAKVMVIDDEFLRIGSANLSNRSMGLDTECDATLVATRESETSSAIRDFRQGLLAEHLGVAQSEIVAAEEQNASLIAAVDSLRDGKRTLEPITREVPEKIDRIVPDSAVIDPEKPIAPKEFLQYLSPDTSTRPIRQYLGLGAVLAVIVTLAALWRWTPLSDLLTISSIEAAAEWIKNSPMAPPLVVIAFIVGSVLAIPLTPMLVATAAVFGPVSGFVYSLLAAEAAAIVTFLIGRALGGAAQRNIAGSRLNALKRRFAGAGVVGIMVLRIVPIAPFTVINVAAGASSLSLRAFAVGNFLGLLPAITAISLLTDRVAELLAMPDTANILQLALVALAVIGTMGLLHAWAKRHRAAGKA